MQKIYLYLLKEEWEKGEVPNSAASIFSSFKKQYPANHCVKIKVTQIVVRVNQSAISLSPEEIYSMYSQHRKLANKGCPESAYSKFFRQIKGFLLGGQKTLL